MATASAPTNVGKVSTERGRTLRVATWPFAAVRRASLRGLVASALVGSALVFTVFRLRHEILHDYIAARVQTFGYHAILLEYLYVVLLDVVLLFGAWLVMRRRDA